MNFAAHDYDPSLIIKPVQGLWLLFTFIGSFPHLFVVGGLLHEIQDGFSESGVCQRISLWIHF